jgi:COMPASS component SWD3
MEVKPDYANYYGALGLEPECTMEELKAAYRDLAKVWHPDRFAHDPRLQNKAQEKLKEINEAYEQLSTPGPARPTSVSHPRHTPHEAVP